MTNQQENVVKRIKEELERSFFYGSKEDYEVKQFEVSEFKYFVSVYAVVGMKNDNGTLASVYCRDTIHVFIGKKGGITYPVHKKLKNGSYKNYTKRLTSIGCLHSVSYDQKYS